TLQLTAFVRAMAASPFIALILLALVVAIRPSALPIAAPILALWIAAPWIAFALSRPIPRRRRRLSSEDRAYLHGVARKTWAYFDAFVGAEDHFLPPDNVQERPGNKLLTVAHRTS